MWVLSESIPYVDIYRIPLKLHPYVLYIFQFEIKYMPYLAFAVNQNEKHLLSFNRMSQIRSLEMLADMFCDISSMWV